MVESIVADGFAAQSQVPHQTYRERLPHPALRELVTSVFIHEIASDSPAYRSRNVPEGTVEIIYRLGPGVPFVAHPLEPVITIVEPGSSFVGLQLRHGAASAVLGVPAAELAGGREELGLVRGRVAETIGARLADVTTPAAAADVLEREILKQCAEAPKPDPVVRELVRRLRPWRARRVMNQTRNLFVSPRQLRRRCLDALGFGPKMLHRLLRFQAFFALVHYQAEGGDLTRLAVRSGYADQAHLSRECLRLSGLTPRAFVADRLVSCVGSHNHSFAELGPVLVSAGVTPKRRPTTFGLSRMELERDQKTTVSFKTPQRHRR